ncbi:hypothetical protein [Geothermobacter hydrogeniphilus]|uniref:Major paralogous domain-containing protein n=1 Tax=Geothermobacter hydrogeniphilus TaxID=1969733 RepID=A0A1X0Y1Y5_9BACT|nr:hypothetical protein [Geothermobacter hydrogeniphilus]ORJ59136.1 hypothetical protein B5V00_11265 [Geothermobacter hydrogeniphilus]
MKYLALIPLFLLLMTIPSLATDDGGDDAYISTTPYPGIYQADRLYQYDDREQIWYGAKRPKLWTTLPCDQARTTLRERGSWTGNLSDSGQCLGDAEAPTWASGNYLNYLTEKNDRD